MGEADDTDVPKVPKGATTITLDIPKSNKKAEVPAVTQDTSKSGEKTVMPTITRKTLMSRLRLLKNPPNRNNLQTRGM